jgi:hypothetical protein
VTFIILYHLVVQCIDIGIFYTSHTRRQQGFVAINKRCTLQVQDEQFGNSKLKISRKDLKDKV